MVFKSLLLFSHGVAVYLSPSQPLQRIENDVELLGEHLSLGAGLHYPPATHPALTPHSTQLHFLSHDPLPQEFFGVVSYAVNSAYSACITFECRGK